MSILPPFRIPAWLRGATLAAAVAATTVAIPAAMAQRADDPAAAALISRNARFHPVVARNGMVAAQDRIAAEVGAEILRKGGNAIDAGVATGFALAVTHPQAGNLGGGGFMLVALAGQNKVVAIDSDRVHRDACRRHAIAR
jgi:gamma-glutamyltranspeptidase/glutathione hydrolase